MTRQRSHAWVARWCASFALLLALLAPDAHAQTKGQLDLRAKGLTDAEIRGAQVSLAASLVHEAHSNLGDRAVNQLQKVRSNRDFVRYLRGLSQRCGDCKTPPVFLQIFARSRVQPGSNVSKAYGPAIIEAWKNSPSYQSSEDDGDEAPPEGEPPDGDGPGDEDPPDEDPPDDGGGDTPPDDGGEEDPCESPLECLSWWGEHIGPCDSDNGGLPETSFPDESGDEGGDGGETIGETLGDILGF